MSLLAGFNSCHQLNLFLIQPLSGHSPKSWNFFQTDWRDHHSSVPLRGTLWILNLTRRSVLCSFPFVSTEFWNGQHRKGKCSLQTQVHLPTNNLYSNVLTPVHGCKTACDPQVFWVLAFQDAVPQIHLIINGWLNTDTKIKNSLWIRHYLKKIKNLPMLPSLSLIHLIILLC